MRIRIKKRGTLAARRKRRECVGQRFLKYPDLHLALNHEIQKREDGTETQAFDQSDTNKRRDDHALPGYIRMK